MFTVRRDENNPLISPHHNRPWRGVGTPNGCPAVDGDGVETIVYRAIGSPDRLEHPDMTRSTVGIARSTDGGATYTEHDMLVAPSTDYDHLGCEDPRVTYIDGVYYIFYTAISHYPYRADDIRVAVAISDDLKTVREKHLVTPFNAKAMCLFPEKVNGKYTVILSVDTDRSHQERIAIAQTETIEQLWDEEFWNNWYRTVDQYTLDLKRHDGDHAEVGAAPVLTNQGWLVVYSHIEEYFTDNKSFGVEAVLLDRDNPWEIVGRTNYPFLVPETVFEQYGYVEEIVFPTGARVKDSMLEVYFGAADTTCCRATMPLGPLLEMVTSVEEPELFTRVPNNPVLLPQGDGWEGKNVFNPAVVEIDGVHYIVYRAQSHDHTSTMGLAISYDGVTVSERLPDPIYVPRTPYEEKRNMPDGFSGCEDPRITRIGDTLYMCYTAYNGQEVPRVAVSTISVEDFVNRNWKEGWSMPVLVTPGGVDDKDACILEDKVGDDYFFIHRISHHICGQFMSDLDFTEAEINRCVEMVHPRRGMWDGLKIGIAGPPHKTEHGWLLFYHGVSQDTYYRVGALLLALDDPTVVLGRTAYPIFSPKKKYELEGDVPRVVFPCGSIVGGDTVYLYYGGADRVVGIATGSLQKILQSVGVHK